MEKKIVLSDKTYLKFIENSDAKALFQQIDDNRDYLSEFLHWPRLTNAIDDLDGFIKHCETNRKKDIYVYGIFYEDQIIGVTGFNDYNKQNRFAAIGYWLAPQFQGKGIMTGSLKILIEKARDELNVRRFEIRCAVENTASAAVAERLGFELEGTLKAAEVVGDKVYDHKLYARVY